MGKLVVVEGAILRCCAGSEPSNLNVTKSFTQPVDGKPVATIFDNEPGTNFKPFGDCDITGKRCDPKIPGPWQPGESSILLPSLFPILSDDSGLSCAEGSGILVENPGQGFFSVDSPFPVTDEEEYFKLKFAGELAGGIFDPLGRKGGVGGGMDQFGSKTTSAGYKFGPEVEGHILRGEVAMKLPGRALRYLPPSMGGSPLLTSDVDIKATVTGPSASGSLGIRNRSLGGDIGVSLVSGQAEVSRKLPVVGKTTASAEAGLKFELGFRIGKETELKLPLVSVGLGFG